MPILLILFGLIAPRVALCVLWCAGVLNGVWTSALWPLLGLVFLPYTTLAYALSHVFGNGVDGVWLLLVILAVAMDLGAIGGSSRERHRRVRRRRA